uniref:RRM domain-containing protein n=1 Tax=Esox lucius TaxID=8010 RepID=A0A3P8ZT34_ESOLU
MFGRGAGGVGRTFDARQKIGMTDVRQRLGVGALKLSGILVTHTHILRFLPPAFQVKDAREKLVQKDARFRIRGRGAGGVQDARQMINSRKEGQSPFNVTPQSLQQKPEAQIQAHMQQIQIHTTNDIASANARQFTPNLQGQNNRSGIAPPAPNRMMDARDRLSLKRSFGTPPSQGMVAPMKITKTIQVVSGKNVSAARGGKSPSGRRSAYISLDRDSRAWSLTLTFHGLACWCLCCILICFSIVFQPAFSPLEGTKITVNNLHPRVTEEDIVELFCVCGALKRARLVKVGVAEVVFVRKEDAVSAYRKYNNRCLDGQPMKCNLHMQGSVITSDQPILLRLSDTPGSGRKEGLPHSLSRPGGRPASSQPTPEVDPQTILKALFKSTAQNPSTTESPGSQSTAFRIKI